MTGTYTFNSARTVRVQARIAAVLDASGKKAMNTTDIAAKVFVERQTVGRHLRNMEANGAAYIADWYLHKTASGAVLAPLWRGGKGISKPRPPKVPKAVKQAAYYQRIKADRERYDAYLARHSTLQRLSRMKKWTKKRRDRVMPANLIVKAQTVGAP